MERVDRTPLMPYRPHAESFVRITVRVPKLVASCRSALEKGLRLANGMEWRSQVFEANVNFSLRFLVDANLSGGGWVEAPGGKYLLRDAKARTSHAQYEVDVHFKAVCGRKAEGEWLGLPPLRILVLHVTTVGQAVRVVAAAAVLQIQGEPCSRHQTSWAVTSGTQDDPPDADSLKRFVRSERELLVQLRKYVFEADADIIVGYDLLNGHLTAVLERAEVCGLFKERDSYGFGRLLGVASRAKSATFETRQLGKHDTKEVNTEGRLLFDVLTVLEREQKLTSYSLSALALHFLGKTRLELRATMIERLSAENPRQLASLALRDADICLRLFTEQQCLVRYVEMARVTGVPIEWLLTRGQSVKVFSMLLRKARLHGYVFPPPSFGASGAEESYEGGAVLDPAVGFYEQPVVTLDFASLYPSIMQRHNLCYSTLLAPGAEATVVADAADSTSPSGPTRGYEEVPELGHRFVTRGVRRGLLPMVLEELLAARALAKKELKAAKDPLTRSVLDGRQLALKVSANSVYGFTGMTAGTLPCTAIAASVTAYGRQMIERTRQVVEAHFCRARGFDYDAQVVYGDTDSVLVSLGRGRSLETAFAFGKEAAEVVSREFGAPVKLEFEKVYMPFLLLNKKRYAGLALTSPEHPGKVDAKGIETVRRDWCPLVRQVVERCLHFLLVERSSDLAVAHAQETVAALRQGRVDPRFLVVSKALVRRGAEAYAVKQTHVELAERLKRRGPPGSAPGVGDRVPYVFLVAPAGTPAHERAEDPLYAVENDMVVDADYYIDHQLKQPLLRIFDPVLGGAAAAEQRLFAGSHTRRVSRCGSGGGARSSGPLAAFVRARAKCLGCRALLSGEAVLCQACARPERTAELMLDTLAAARAREGEAAGLLSECARCEFSFCGGGLHAACANVDCPIFFRRAKVLRELSDVQESLRKLRMDYDW
eukprot:TRINITY_DN33127_c0_g1_i1.p1 TRINITY_DN33127_c0_g1~~TRINITY_DN33127_c0_g1_i1.p1  ORF type:complete len:1023 (+),score=215.96 TRINITY_DN33127_c0_g1_i1:250-3069(+)